MYQCPWCGVFGPNFLDLPQFPKYTKTGITQPWDGLYPWVRLHLMWNVEFNFWMTFCVSLSLIWGNWATFCQLAPVPQIHEKSINWPSDDLLHLRRALLGFIWCEMKSLTLWMIFFVLLLWQGEFGPNLPNVLQFAKYTKTGITWPADDLYIWVKLHLMWNIEFNTLDNSLCIDAHDLGNLGLIFLTCPNSTDTAVINWLWDGLYIWVRLHLMWNVYFNTLNDMAMTWGIWSQLLHYFSCVTLYDLGVFGPYFPKLP